MEHAAYRQFHDKIATEYNKADPILRIGTPSNLKSLHGLQAVKLDCCLGHINALKLLITTAVLCLGHAGEAIRISAAEKHDKQVIRIAASEALQNQGRMDLKHDTFMDTLVRLNFKKDEWAKPGKNGRIVCDLTTPASIRGGFLCSIAKTCWQDYEPTVGLGKLQFVLNPNREILRETFIKLRDGTHFCYHSDDSCASFKCSDGFYRICLDIAACDSSQGPAVFQLLRHIAPMEYDNIMLDLINQCSTGCVLGFGKTQLKFKPNWYFEYSGTTLTTLLNNLANMCIGHQLMSIPFGTVSETRSRVAEVLRFCGWLVTVIECECLEDLQFLKCSPHLTIDGALEVALNLGVILRSLGQRAGDLPGKGDFESRANDYNSGIVLGLKHAGTHALTSLLRRKFDRVVKPVFTNATISLSGSDIGEISDSSICRRYKFTQADLDHLLELLRCATIGDTYHCVASAAILKLDYGL